MADKVKITEIRAKEDKYGLMVFRMALSHVIDVGHRNFSEENVTAAIEQIKKQGDEDASNGVIKVMTPDFECAIVYCAAELAKFSIWDLLSYIKKHVTVN